MEKKKSKHSILSEFTRFCGVLRGVSMIVSTHQRGLDLARNALARKGYVYCQGWKDAIKSISGKERLCMEIDKDDGKEVYDFIIQHNSARGFIQIVDQIDLSYSSVEFDPNKSNLIVLITEEQLADFERCFPIMSQVNMVERISYPSALPI